MPPHDARVRDNHPKQFADRYKLFFVPNTSQEASVCSRNSRRVLQLPQTPSIAFILQTASLRESLWLFKVIIYYRQNKYLSNWRISGICCGGVLTLASDQGQVSCVCTCTYVSDDVFSERIVCLVSPLADRLARQSLVALHQKHAIVASCSDAFSVLDVCSVKIKSHLLPTSLKFVCTRLPCTGRWSAPVCCTCNRDVT